MKTEKVHQKIKRDNFRIEERNNFCKRKSVETKQDEKLKKKKKFFIQQSICARFHLFYALMYRSQMFLSGMQASNGMSTI